MALTGPWTHFLFPFRERKSTITALAVYTKGTTACYWCSSLTYKHIHTQILRPLSALMAHKATVSSIINRHDSLLCTDKGISLKGTTWCIKRKKVIKTVQGQMLTGSDEEMINSVLIHTRKPMWKTIYNKCRARNTRGVRTSLVYWFPLFRRKSCSTTRRGLKSQRSS